MTAFRWGDPDSGSPLPPAIRAMPGPALAAAPRPPPVVLAPPASLPAALRADTLDGTRLAHAAGRSTVDLLRARRGEVPGVPDGVARPASQDEVLEVLRIAAAGRVAVVRYGGGTSVVGGLRARRDGLRGVVALDLGRLDRLIAVDPVSRTVTLYFTVVAAQAGDPVAQWQAAASGAIVRAGATISRHHGVGRDHRHRYGAEIGPVGAGLLRAVKAAGHPAGVLNPGVLLS